MAQRKPQPMALGPDDLNELDNAVLGLLVDGRITPTLGKRMLDERNPGRWGAISRQYVNQRLTRLAEHGHAENLYDTGVYELREDPRDD